MISSFYWFLTVLIQFLLFLFIYILVRNINPQGIIFYQGLTLIELLSLVYLLFYFLKKKSIEYALTKLPIIFTSAILAYSFVMTLPVVLDRSITLHFLSYLTSNSPSTVSKIQKDFIDNFVVNSQAVEKRVDEQLVIGNLYIEDNQIYISNRGFLMHRIFDFLTKVFRINTTYKQ
jgi:hypothetical protein